MESGVAMARQAIVKFAIRLRLPAALLL